MRTLNAILLFVAIIIPVSASAEPVKDLAGWSDTRWGMSVDDLTKLHHDFTIGVDNYGSTAGRLPDLTIGNTPFQVFFMFPGVGGLRKEGTTEPPKSEWRLSRVELFNADSNACYSVTEPLLGKYGQPAKRESGFNLWILPTTTIRQVSTSGLHCVIIYHPSVKNDNL